MSAVTAGWLRLLLQLWSCLSARRQRQFVLLLGLILISAFAEVFALGAVLPFLGILIAPEKVFHYSLVARLVKFWGITAPTQLILPLTVMFTAAALLAGGIRLLLLWVSTRLAFATGSDFSIEVYRRTLYQPYRAHLALSSSEVISGITNKVADTVTALNQFLLLISWMVLLLSVIVTLLIINPTVALFAIVSLGGSYGAITWAARRRLRRNSQRIATEQTQMIKALQEGLGGIRDVLLDGTQPLYCDVYRRADQPLRRAQGFNIFIGGSPRPIMEAFGMIVIAALAYSLSRKPSGVATALPLLGTLALGAQRLLPALQQSYGAWVTIAGSQAALAKIVELLHQPVPAEMLQPSPDPLALRETIAFSHVRFRYTSDGPWVLDDLSFAIERGSRVGFVGATGSGKTTALDVLMGLLPPTEGDLLVDGEAISGPRVRGWQRSIAHVPQSIYLADKTIAENIAFGVPRANIDLERVKMAARQAQLTEFIDSCREGYDARVGERGVRLSGGQRQRVGIARALYRQASVLVFDEATSALDNVTEQSVMEAISSLGRDLTIVLIAHRLTTIQRCDLIFELERGRLVAQGSYEQLIGSSPSFRRMARAVA